MAAKDPYLQDGLYAIENKQYGPINRGNIPKSPHQYNIPVISDRESATWKITHVEGYAYKIELVPYSTTPSLSPNLLLSAREEKNFLFVNEATPSADLWYIVDHGEYYVIFKELKFRLLQRWVLGADDPGTQVQVLTLPLEDGHPQASGVETADLGEASLKTLLDNNEFLKDLLGRIDDNSLWRIRADRHRAQSIPHEPKILWIGCSDARVPESVMNFPDQIFVHRNIANQFHLTDINAASVLIYGLTGIKNKPIREIRVVGHSYCGGVQACHDAANGIASIDPGSALGAWLAPLRMLAEEYKNRPPIELARENVRVQVKNVKETMRGLGLDMSTAATVKGFVYHIGTGKFEPIV